MIRKTLLLLAVLGLACGMATAQHKFPATDTDNVFTGQNQFTKGITPGTVIVSGLAGLSPIKGQIVAVSDALTTSDCTVGGGTAVSYCGFNGISWVSIGSAGSGTVTSLSVGNLSPLFNSSVANPGSTPAVTFTALSFAAHTFYGNNTGISATPAAVQLACADLSNSAASCSTDTTNAGNISSGFLALARGGLATSAANISGHTYFGNNTGIAGAGGFVQPSFADISGTATTAQIGTGTPAASKYVDGLTGAWTNLPTTLAFSGLTSSTNTSATMVVGTGASIAPSSATVGTVSANQINGTSLSSLATGILKNTTTTGVPTIAAFSDVNALITPRTNCLSLTFVFEPASGNCIATGGTVNANNTTHANAVAQYANNAGSTTITPLNNIFTDNNGGMTMLNIVTGMFGPDWVQCDVQIAQGTYADLPACIDALVATGGGVATFFTQAVGSNPSTGGTFTTPLNIGTTAATKAQVVLILGQGVRLLCNVTNWKNCANFGDGSGIFGYGTDAVQALNQPAMPAIEVAGTAQVYDVIAPMDPLGDGNQQSMFVNGVSVIPAGSSKIADAVIHEIGLFSGTYVNNFYAAPIQSVGLLIDNGDKSTFTPTSTVVSGTNVTMTVSASTTRTPNAHRIGGTVGTSGRGATAYVTVTNCAGGVATPANINGTWPVTLLGSGLNTIADAQQSFQFSVSFAPGNGSATGCTYKVTTSTGAFGASQGINTVINHSNIVIAGVSSGNAHSGARPFVMSPNGASVQLGQMNFTGTENYENPDTSFPNLDFDGNGLGGFSNFGQMSFQTEIHCEPYNNATATSVAPCIRIRDVHNLVFGVIDASGASNLTNYTTGSGTATNAVVEISQSASNRTGNITIASISNNNYPATIVNLLSSDRPIIGPVLDATGHNTTGDEAAQYFFPGATQAGPVNPFLGANDPLDTNKVVIDENFFPSSNGACRGLYGWNPALVNTGSCGTTTNPTSLLEVGHVIIQTSTTVGSVYGIGLDAGTVAPLYALGNNSGAPWEAIMIVQPITTGELTAVTGADIRVGFMTAATAANPPQNGIYIRYASSASDTAWQLCNDLSNIETCTPITGVTPTVGTQAKFRIRGPKASAPIIYAQVEQGGTWTSEVSMCASGCTLTATPYTGTLAPKFMITNGANGTQFQLGVHRFKFEQHGLGQ